jgi:hypothetical protein
VKIRVQIAVLPKTKTKKPKKTPKNIRERFSDAPL